MSIKHPAYYYSSSAPSSNSSLAQQIFDAKMSLTVEPSIVAITPDVYLGNFASSVSPALIFRHCITSIIAITSTPPSAYTGSLQNQRRASLPQVSYHYVQCNDKNSSNLLQHLPQLCDNIERLTKLGRVLVHCSQGLSRSPAVVVGYLMKKEGKSVDAVLAQVKRKRDVRIREGFIDQLRVWEEVEFELFEDGSLRANTAKGPYRELLERLEGGEGDNKGSAQDGNDCGKERRGSI